MNAGASSSSLKGQRPFASRYCSIEHATEVSVSLSTRTAKSPNVRSQSGIAKREKTRNGDRTFDVVDMSREYSLPTKTRGGSMANADMVLASRSRQYVSLFCCNHP